MSRPGSPSIRGLAKRSFWLVFGGIWLSVGLVMIVAAVGMAVQERAWATESVRTTGMVLTKDIVPADSDSSTQYRIRFRFTTLDDGTVEGDQQVEIETWERMVERGPIEVFYLPSSPSAARLEPGADAIGILLFSVLGAVFGGIGGVLFGRAFLGLLRARRLLRSGVATDGRVTSVDPTDVSFNRQPQFRVRYTYRDGQGAEHTGDSGYLDPDEASPWDVGDRVAIRYDPRRPAENQWVGRIEAPPPTVDAAPPA